MKTLISCLFSDLSLRNHDNPFITYCISRILKKSYSQQPKSDLRLLAGVPTPAFGPRTLNLVPRVPDPAGHQWKATHAGGRTLPSCPPGWAQRCAAEAWTAGSPGSTVCQWGCCSPAQRWGPEREEASPGCQQRNNWWPYSKFSSLTSPLVWLGLRHHTLLTSARTPRLH